MLAYFNKVPSTGTKTRGPVLKILGTRHKNDAAYKCFFLFFILSGTKLVPSNGTSLLRREDFADSQ